MYKATIFGSEGIDEKLFFAQKTEIPYWNKQILSNIFDIQFETNPGTKEVWSTFLCFFGYIPF